MTLVVVLQVVVAGFVSGLILERSTRPDESDWPFAPTDDSGGTLEFHPELIVRWDDEANAVAATACCRRSASDRRVRARTQSASPRPRSFIR